VSSSRSQRLVVGCSRSVGGC